MTCPLESYAGHPTHVALKTTHIAPLLAADGVLAVDLMVPASIVAGAGAGEEKLEQPGLERQFSNSGLVSLKDAFDSFDANGDGLIDADEISSLSQIMTGKQLSRDEATRVLQMLDKDSDGSVDFGEFCMWFGTQKDAWSLPDPNVFMMGTKADTMPEFGENMFADLKNSFDAFDMDGSGKLDVAELKSFSETLALGTTVSAERLAAATAILDKNDDGLISFPEFVEYFAELPVWKLPASKDEFPL
jgi:Ca2+-binding EF-hand superfamily protein